MDSHQTFPGTERTPAAVVAELQYGPTMVSGPYRKRNLQVETTELFRPDSSPSP
jgi:hypothetical protein